MGGRRCDGGWHDAARATRWARARYTHRPRWKCLQSVIVQHNTKYKRLLSVYIPSRNGIKSNNSVSLGSSNQLRQTKKNKNDESIGVVDEERTCRLAQRSLD